MVFQRPPVRNCRFGPADEGRSTTPPTLTRPLPGRAWEGVCHTPSQNPPPRGAGTGLLALRPLPPLRGKVGKGGVRTCADHALDQRRAAGLIEKVQALQVGLEPKREADRGGCIALDL